MRARVLACCLASLGIPSVLRAASAGFPIKFSSLLSSRVSTSTAFGTLEAATRGRDLLKLAHRRTDSSPARPVRPPIWKADSRDTPPSFWALALHGSGWDAPWDYRGIPPPKDQSWGPDSIVLRLGPGVMIHQRTGRTDDMRSWSHRPRLSPTRSSTSGTDDSRPPTSATICLLASVLQAASPP